MLPIASSWIEIIQMFVIVAETIFLIGFYKKSKEFESALRKIAEKFGIDWSKLMA